MQAVPASTIVGQASVVSGTTTIYEWFESPDNSAGSYTAIGGTNSVSYSPGNLTSTTFFKRKTTSILGTAICSEFTDPQRILVTVVNPVLTVNPGAIAAPGVITVCNPLDAVFTGSGGASYEFFIDNISAQPRSPSITFSSTLITNNVSVTVIVYDRSNSGWSMF